MPGGDSITRNIPAYQWVTGGWGVYSDMEIGVISIVQNDTSLLLYNFDWAGESLNYHFMFMHLRGLKLVPVAGGETVTLAPGSAALSCTDPSFPARFNYNGTQFSRVEPVYTRIMTDFVNLASSIAHPLGYLPVTRDVMERINNALRAVGREDEIITRVITIDNNTQITDALHNDLLTTPAILDMTSLAFDSFQINFNPAANPNIVYTISYDTNRYLYDNWWRFNSRRLILNTLTDNDGRYRMSASSDIAAATGAARVGLAIDVHNNLANPSSAIVRASRYLYEQFLYDMAANRTITGEAASTMGWNINEGAFIQAGTTYAIGALPSQYFSSGTFFAGTARDIRIPEVPKRAALDRETVYITVYMSDGDNLQFIQNQTGIIWHELWDSITDPNSIPINWTMAPSLVDIAPGMLNWFYDNAGPSNVFVAGPSGAQYLTPFSNAGGSMSGTFLGENPAASSGLGPNNGQNNLRYMEFFSQLNEEYMRRSGLRVATLWHNFPPEVREMFERYNRFMYGTTIQRPNTPWPSSTENDRLRFERFLGGLDYATNRANLQNSIIGQINAWYNVEREDGATEPLFIQAQVDTWDRGTNDATSVSVRHLNIMAQELKAHFGAEGIDVVFVRADHWFSLLKEYMGLPFDLAMSADTVVTSNTGDNMARLTNGSHSANQAWESSFSGEKVITFDFGNEHEINRFVIRQAAGHEVSNYSVEYSADGANWTPVMVLASHSQVDIDIDILPVDAQFIRLTLHDTGTVRIGNIEIYGRLEYVPIERVVPRTDIYGDTTRLISANSVIENGRFFPNMEFGHTWAAANRLALNHENILASWGNGDCATWHINVQREGVFRLYMYCSKTGAFDKNPLDIKIFLGDTMVIENGLYVHEATNNWNTYQYKFLGEIVLTANDSALSMTNDGSVNRPLGPSANPAIHTVEGPAGNGLNYYQIRWLRLDFVSDEIPKGITSYTPLEPVNIDDDRNLLTLTQLIASGELPTRVEVINTTHTAETGYIHTRAWADITGWTGSFDGTTVGAYTLTAVWGAPAGFRKIAATPTITITVNVNTAQIMGVVTTINSSGAVLMAIDARINRAGATGLAFAPNPARLQDWRWNDTASWNINVTEPGEYRVFVYSVQGAGNIAGVIPGVLPPFPVRMTTDHNAVIEGSIHTHTPGNWNVYSRTEIGVITFPEGFATFTMGTGLAVAIPGHAGINFYRVQHIEFEFVPPTDPRGAIIDIVDGTRLLPPNATITQRLSPPGTLFLSGDTPPDLRDWKNDDIAFWNIDVVQPGTYRVYLTYSANAGGFNNSTAFPVVILRDSVLALSNNTCVLWTGNWNVYREVAIGTIELSFGDTTFGMTNTGFQADGFTRFADGVNHYRLREIRLVFVEETTVPVFSFDVFNNGFGGSPSRPNASLAAAGTIRMWMQLDGVATPIYLAAEDTVTALDQNGNCAMEFVHVNRVWDESTGWQDYINVIDVGKSGQWQYINLSMTVFGQTVEVLLVNALFEVIPPPVFTWSIFNNGPGGAPSIANPGLAAAGTIRMWTQLDGANAPIYFDATQTITALDQDGNCAMAFVQATRMWEAGTGWLDYANRIDVNKNGDWITINLSITVYGQLIEVLLVNANHTG